MPQCRYSFNRALFPFLIAWATTVNIAAQPSPGSIVTHTLPIVGPSVIDTAGNVVHTTGAVAG